MACPGDVEVRYSTHSRLSVDVTVTGNLDGMLDPQKRAITPLMSDTVKIEETDQKKLKTKTEVSGQIPDSYISIEAKK